MTGKRFFVAADIGQAHDPTAIAVLERAELKGTFDPVMYAFRKKVRLRLRYLERVELGTTYPRVVERIAEVTRARQLAGCCDLAVDATGVGRPVVDMLRKERLGGPLYAATITGGSTESYVDGYWRVPKRELITRLQILFQREALQIASGMKWVPELMKEMADMRVKVTCSGHAQFEAWREGTHDDLVFAVSLACWKAQKAYPWEPAGEDAYWLCPPCLV